jgi:hypothetical protein
MATKDLPPMIVQMIETSLLAYPHKWLRCVLGSHADIPFYSPP